MNLKKAIRDMFHALDPQEKEKDRRDALATGQLFKHATYQRRGGHRHRPYTKPPLTGESKKRRKMAAKSRRINRKK